MDIVFGAKTAISGIKYALFVVNRATRKLQIYSLCSLKNDLLPALQQFCSEIGRRPTRILTDFDHKLCGKRVLEYFSNPDSTSSIIESAPPKHQNQNGLAERNWGTVLRMARSWLASSLLPSKFWFFALKRATEVSNYMPLKINNKITTPFEQCCGVKPDLRTLFPMCSVSYITKLADSTQKQLNLHNKSIRAIAVGRSLESNCLLFFHLPSSQTFTSDDFRFNETLAAGPSFNVQYDWGAVLQQIQRTNTAVKISNICARPTSIYILIQYSSYYSHHSFR